MGIRRTTYLIGGVVVAGAALVWRRITSRGSRGEQGVLDARQVQRLYAGLAPHYELLAFPYRLVGSRRLAKRGIDLLNLHRGDTVVDLGCGTGVNLPYLADAVGPEGRVVGVDLSEEMLAQARRRLADLPGHNVDLVKQDVRDFEYPEPLHGVVATFTLEIVPEYEEVVRRACERLSRTGGRIAVIGLRRPNWPQWAIDLGIALGRPFGVSEAYEAFHPWEAIRRHAQEVTFETIAVGSIYLSVGEAG